MDKFDSDLVNLHDTQADPTDVARVHLRSTQEDTRMLKPEVVDRIRELSGQGLGSKRIARELRISRNSVRRYLAGATAGFQERPAARLLDAATLREVHDLFGTVAEGNTVVIQQELARRGTPRRAANLATSCRAPSPGATGRGPGHGPVRDPTGSTDPDRLRREGRAYRRATGEGLPDDRGPGILAPALLPGLPGPAAGRLARGTRWSLPTLRRPHRAGPLRQRLASGHVPRSRVRPGGLESGLRGLLPGSGIDTQGLPPPPGPHQGEDRTGRRLRQAQRPGRAIVRLVRRSWSVTWRHG